jgi:hypothetical protein
MFGEILSRIGLCLTRHSIPYMIIGGQALLVYGEPRLTRDIDIVLGVDSRCVNLLVAIAGELHLKPVPDDIKGFVRQTMVFPAVEESTGIRVDFILASTPYELNALKRVRKLKINGSSVLFASPEDVIIHKIIAGRPRDLDDVRKIIVKNSDIDMRYIRERLREFDVASGKGDLQRTFDSLSLKYY